MSMTKINGMLSKKQQEFLFSKDERINILTGSVRSGKTYVSLIKFALFVGNAPKTATFLMAGVTLTTLKRNCLMPLMSLVGSSNFWFSMSSKEGRLFNRTVYFEGANDRSSEEKIRGLTLSGAYCDEATLMHEDFFAMLLSRLSEEGALVYVTCNPDTPSNYIKKKYMDRSDYLSCSIWNFLLKDNTFLNSAYIENLKKEYIGVFYERFILGKWVKAEGLIYQKFDEALGEPEGSATEYCLSIDYGTENPFAALIFGKFENGWGCIDEYYYNGREIGVAKTDMEYAEVLDDFTEKYREFEGKKGRKLETIIDPSAASFKTLMKKRTGYRVRNGDNAVKDGIRETATAMHTKKLFISERCKNLIQELEGYVWDDNENPVKENDHACDALRYFVKTKHIVRKALRNRR